MAVRLIVAITAAPGKGAELAELYKARCAEVMSEPAVNSLSIPECRESIQAGLLERWADQRALEAHSKLNNSRPPFSSELRTGTTLREDYEYNRTR